MTRVLIQAASLAAVLSAPAAAQHPPPASPPAEAYYHFILGRHLESSGDIERAIASYREAARLDPSSAEIRAELSALLTRQGDVEAAETEARAALALDAQNREANRVLGSILASASESGATRDGRPAPIAEAIAHLERGRRTDGVDADPTLDLTLARLYVRAARHDEAVAVLTDLVAREPIPDAWLLLAQAHTAAGRLGEAARALEEGAQTDPRLFVSLGELYERQEQWARAATAYERAARLNPRSSDLKTRWAGTLLNLPDASATRRARELLEEAAGAQPTDSRTLYLLSQAQRKARDFGAAEATARRVIALDPRSIWGPWALAQVYEDRRNYKGVVDTLTAALADWTPTQGASSRNAVTLLTHLGFAQLQLGRYDEAVTTFTRAKEGSAGDTSGFDLFLAQAHLSGRRYDAALELLRPLRTAKPHDLRLAQLEARALAGSGRRDEAIAVLQQALDANPGEPTAYLSLADMLAEASRAADAQEVLDRAAARFPDNVTIPFQRGALLERARQYDRAEAEFRVVLARDPLHAPALNYLGYMLAEQGDRLEEAVQLIERALKIDPGNGSYLDSLGWAFFQQRRYEEAHEHLARAAEQLPSNSVVQDHLGDALAALGRHAEAIAAWQRALDGDGESVDLAVVRTKIARARERAAR
jgi:tetratricopeptide (TPR) repeat protein